MTSSINASLSIHPVHFSSSPEKSFPKNEDTIFLEGQELEVLALLDKGHTTTNPLVVLQALQRKFSLETVKKLCRIAPFEINSALFRACSEGNYKADLLYDLYQYARIAKNQSHPEAENIRRSILQAIHDPYALQPALCNKESPEKILRLLENKQSYFQTRNDFYEKSHAAIFATIFGYGQEIITAIHQSHLEGKIDDPLLLRLKLPISVMDLMQAIPHLTEDAIEAAFEKLSAKLTTRQLKQMFFQAASSPKIYKILVEKILKHPEATHLDHAPIKQVLAAGLHDDSLCTWMKKMRANFSKRELVLLSAIMQPNLPLQFIREYVLLFPQDIDTTCIMKAHEKGYLPLRTLLETRYKNQHPEYITFRQQAELMP